jgi:adenylate cyclase class IV
MDADAEVFMDHPLLRLGDRGQSVVLRFRPDHSFGLVRMDGHTGAGPPPEIHAAGPVERILQGIGFRPIFRTVTLRQSYFVCGRRVQVLHVDPLGWYCEFEADDDGFASEMERRLGLDPRDREGGSYGDLARAAARGLERRRSERRRRERRRTPVVPKAERRSGRDRRDGATSWASSRTGA